MTDTGLCPELDDRGRRCQRWDLPTAHTDGEHQHGLHRWPVAAPLDLDAASGAAPARTEATT